jgi:hypothetical protein
MAINLGPPEPHHYLDPKRNAEGRAGQGMVRGCRWAAGEPHYDDLEARHAAAPAIAVPAITLEGGANGAPHLDASAYAGKYEHRVIEGRVGHNLPQETPHAFAQAVVDVDHF